MTTTLAQLNTCDAASFVSMLHGIYEHSPWIAQRRRPFSADDAELSAQVFLAFLRGFDPAKKLYCMVYMLKTG